jgi:hypothetical protein
MEKPAAGAGAGCRREFARALAFALPSLCCAALAQDASSVAGAARGEQGVRVQVQASNLPRFDSQDTGFQGPRVDLSITPFDRRGNGLGAVFGLASPSGGPGLQPRTGIDVGLRWSQLLQSQRIDITAWRRMNVPDDAYTQIIMREPVYGARVEMNLASAQHAGLAMDLGFVGLQMESGARITIKRKDGRPMVYYRTSF